MLSYTMRAVFQSLSWSVLAKFCNWGLERVSENPARRIQLSVWGVMLLDKTRQIFDYIDAYKLMVY
jgi:hypothetical protein